MITKCINMKHRSARRILLGEMTQTRRFEDFGNVGDHLIVREAFKLVRGECFYAADHEDPKDDGPWRSARHMPRAHCRMLLKITRKWREPILSISQSDAKEVSGSRDAFMQSIRENFGEWVINENPDIYAYEFKRVCW